MSFEDLAREIESGRAVLVLGSGVSAFTTGGASCSTWEGFLRSGLDFAASWTAVTEGWRDWVEGDFRQASSSSDALIAAAEKIVRQLGGVGDPLYMRWLQSTIGALTVENDSLISVLDKLGCPITTTNYDLLLERVTGRSSCSWRQPQLAIEALRSSSTDILHWHGEWRSPESLVLNAQSYGAILTREGAQNLQRAVSTLHSFIFIGMGAGLDDPNFSSLLAWTREFSPGVRHFRLCLNSEVALFKDQSSHITPVPYGDRYDDLIGFLQRFVDRAAVETRQWSAVGSYSVEAIDQRLRSELILAEHVAEAASLSTSELLIPPVILPIPPDQFASQLINIDDSSPMITLNSSIKRCDPKEEAARGGLTLFVADELAGLTTTLQWMLQTRASLKLSATPIFLDFVSLTAGARPLERESGK